MNLKKIFVTFAFLFTANTVFALEIVGQKDKKFSVSSLTVKVGDRVEFKNEDPFFHNVFSLSDTQMFDLGSYPQGESKWVTFEQAGKVVVECAIHPSMQMVINVE